MAAVRYLVYEVVNPATKEAVVGVSDVPDLEALKVRHRSYPPVWVARWAARPPRYRLLESGLSHEAAQAAARRHAREQKDAHTVVIVTG